MAQLGSFMKDVTVQMGWAPYTPQQITQSCLPTLLLQHTLTQAHTHVFQLCNRAISYTPLLCVQAESSVQ